LLSLISTILGLMSNLIAGEVFVIKLLSNPLYLYNKLLLLVLLWVFTFYSTVFALEAILEELALLLDNLLSLSIINLKIRSSTLIFLHLCLR
jgi:choline-glycine betaine transporter